MIIPNLMGAQVPGMINPGGGPQEPMPDAITLARMLQILPEIQGKKRKGDRLREAKGQLEELAKREGRGGMMPTQHGGLFQTVGQYRPDYSEVGNKVVGALGSYLAGRQADTADADFESQRGGEILNTLEGLGTGNEGGATSQALRGYLGLLGGPDAKDLGIPGQLKARGVQVDADGNVMTQMTDGSWVPAGFKARSGMRVIRDEVTGQVYQVPTTTAGQAGEVTLGGSAPPEAPPPAPLTPGAPAPGTAGTTVNIDTLSPEQNEQLSAILSGLPSEHADALVQIIGSRPQTVGQPSAGGVQPPAAGPRPLRMSSAADIAAAKESGKIGAQLANAPATSAAAATEKGMLVDAETAAKARASLPQAQVSLQNSINTAQKLLSHPGLTQIVGGLGGRIPDGPTAMNYFRAVMAGSPAADAMALHQQAKGEVFLQAYQLLKGGGQITEVEGQKAEAAMARMDRAQSIEAYRAAVNDFIETLKQGYAKVEAASRGGYSAQPGAAPAPALPPGFSWEP